MPDPVEGDVVALTSHEIASRLSYLFWGSMPDEELFDAADRGKLGEPEELEAQARRMLADPRARAAIAEFHEQWLELEKLDTMSKDGAAYPAYPYGCVS